jgi:hypothetical protein
LHEGIGHLGIRYGVRAKFLDALALSSPGESPGTIAITL